MFPFSPSKLKKKDPPIPLFGITSIFGSQEFAEWLGLFNLLPQMAVIRTFELLQF